VYVVDPQVKCFEDVELFAAYHDRQKFMDFIMALCEDFESTWASLLHCTFIHSLKVGVAKLIFEENHCSTMKRQSPYMVVVVASHGASKSPIHLSGHSTSQSSLKDLLLQILVTSWLVSSWTLQATTQNVVTGSLPTVSRDCSIYFFYTWVF